jgi:hypothetical protein
MAFSLVRALLGVSRRYVEPERLVSTTGMRPSSSQLEELMKYLLLIYHNPGSRELWEEFTDAQRVEGLQAYAALNEDLAGSGELIVTEALADSSLAKRVSVQEGRAVTSDGPFAEAKEHLAGFYLVQCESLERAIEIAAMVPEAAIGSVEVRPILTYSALEM